MPSAEHYYQRHPQETPTPSPRLQAVITDLAAYYEVAITQAAAHFRLARPQQAQQWSITNLDGHQINVARCPVADETFMVPDIDVVLAINRTEWQIMRVVHTDAVWTAYAQAASAQGQPLSERQENFPFGAFAEYVAHLIEVDVRIEQASDRAAVKAWLALE